MCVFEANVDAVKYSLIAIGFWRARQDRFRFDNRFWKMAGDHPWICRPCLRLMKV